MFNTDKFGTAINCIDGRVQVPVTDWIKLHTQVQFVDMITEPGVDKVLAEVHLNKINSLTEKLRISLHEHNSSIIAVVGHFDCAANNVSIEEHKEQIQQSVDLVNSWNTGVRIVGLFVNEWMSVDLVCDTNEDFKEIKSFL